MPPGPTKNSLAPCFAQDQQARNSVASNCDSCTEMASEILREHRAAVQQAQPQIDVPAIAYCEAYHDYVSRELFDPILKSEEEHFDWLETQLGLIKKVGLENYRQSQTCQVGRPPKPLFS